MDEIFVYEVYDIREVYPADVDDLRIEDDKDLCTLVTCTPYGINTMRLLVMGKRVYPEEVIERDSNGNVTIEDHEVIIDPAVWIFIGFGVFIILMILVSIISNIIKKNKNRKAAVKHEKE
jgi:sortase A